MSHLNAACTSLDACVFDLNVTHRFDSICQLKNFTPRKVSAATKRFDRNCMGCAVQITVAFLLAVLLLASLLKSVVFCFS